MSSSNQRTGQVWLTDFDRGVITTLGAEIIEVTTASGGETSIYAIKNMQGISAPPDVDGVPVYFAFGDETIDDKILPSIVVRRDDISPAMSRWHLGNEAYRVVALGANPVTVLHPITGEVWKEGFDEVEYQDQAIPVDITYTIQIRARYRNNLQVEAMKMLHYVMKKYQPYTSVYLIDSLGDKRSYEAFMESPSAMDDMADIAGRFTGFNCTLRVEGELDLNDPVTEKVVTGLPSINFRLKKNS